MNRLALALLLLLPACTELPYNDLLPGTATGLVVDQPAPAAPAAPPQEPLAVVEYSPGWPAMGTTVYYDGTFSSAEGGVVGYFWEFGDGATGTGPKPTHQYSGAPGVYTVAVTVTDAQGRTARTARQIVVADTTAPRAAIAAVYIVPAVADDVQVVGVTWTVDGVAQPLAINPPFTLVLDYAALAEGTHTAAVVSTDRIGNNSPPAVVTFTK